MIRTYSQMHPEDKYSQHRSIIWPVVITQVPSQLLPCSVKFPNLATKGFQHLELLSLKQLFDEGEFAVD